MLIDDHQTADELNWNAGVLEANLIRLDDDRVCSSSKVNSVLSEFRLRSAGRTRVRRPSVCSSRAR